MRNSPLLAIAYDTLLRQSELVALLAQELEQAPDASGTVLARRSKTDQKVEGAVKYIAPDTVALLLAWHDTAEGSLFRFLSKDGHIEYGVLGNGEVAGIFRELAASAVLRIAWPPSSHSTRVGVTHDMFAAEVEFLEAMQAGVLEDAGDTGALPGAPAGAAGRGPRARDHARQDLIRHGNPTPSTIPAAPTCRLGSRIRRRHRNVGVRQSPRPTRLCSAVTGREPGGRSGGTARSCTAEAARTSIGRPHPVPALRRDGRRDVVGDGAWLIQ